MGELDDAIARERARQQRALEKTESDKRPARAPADLEAAIRDVLGRVPKTRIVTTSTKGFLWRRQRQETVPPTWGVAEYDSEGFRSEKRVRLCSDGTLTDQNGTVLTKGSSYGRKLEQGGLTQEILDSMARIIVNEPH